MKTETRRNGGLFQMLQQCQNRAIEPAFANDYPNGCQERASAYRWTAGTCSGSLLAHHPGVLVGSACPANLVRSMPELQLCLTLRPCSDGISGRPWKAYLRSFQSVGSFSWCASRGYSSVMLSRLTW